MPAYSSAYKPNAVLTDLPLPQHKTKTSETIPQEVYQYTQVLNVASRREDVDQAFMRLAEIDCPIHVFDQCRTEIVVLKTFQGKDEYIYQVNKLLQKFAMLRKKELQRMNPHTKICFAETEEEMYDPEYPRIRSSIEMEKYKPPKKSTLISKYAEYIPTLISPSSTSSSSPSDGSIC